MGIYLGGSHKKLIVNGKKYKIIIPKNYSYVSLGDSIAAGHTINDEWSTNYGEDSQYGKNGNTSTVIVPDSYTDLIRNELVSRQSNKIVSATSFARSGDTVADLMEKLNHTIVRDTIKKASLITVCIGANDVLQPALHNLDEYINTGSLSNIEAIIEGNFTKLTTDSNPTSYVSLFNKLTEINPNAQIVFTTIYNPYKYLWLEEGTGGFFSPILSVIPDIDLFGWSVSETIKNTLLGTSYVQLLFNRVNGLNAWAEKYVTRLNQVLRDKISSYQAINPNITLADTKALYDTFPDRTVPAQKHYNDLVNVEYTRGYDTMQMDWGRLYEGSDAATWWTNLIVPHVSLSGIDIETIGTNFVTQMIEKVIMPDVDPHPEWYGHYALKRAFTDALGWESLDRYSISYKPNGGIGSMETQHLVGVDGLPAFTNIKGSTFTPPQSHYDFNGWKTEGGTSYAVNQLVGLTSNLDLYAQWGVQHFTVTFKHSQGDVIQMGSGQTGPMENYALFIDGVEQADLGAFANSPRTYSLPYGTNIEVVAQTNSGSARSYVTFNGTKVAGTSKDARYNFTLTSNVTINFEWNEWQDFGLDGWIPTTEYVSYWNCYITT